MSGVIKVAGQKMSEKHRNEVLSTLLALQTTAQEGHRYRLQRNLYSYIERLISLQTLSVNSCDFNKVFLTTAFRNKNLKTKYCDSSTHNMHEQAMRGMKQEFEDKVL